MDREFPLGLLIVASLLIMTVAPAQALDRNLAAAGPPRTPPAYESRQGGDHPEDAVLIPSLPFTDSGNTTGMDNDYATDCPYGLSGFAPDVFYIYGPDEDMSISVDLCGSHYDTCVYVVDADTWQMIACNDDYYFDDFCGIYTSRIDSADLSAGGRYWIIVDGYPFSYGEYELLVDRFVLVDVPCPPDAMPEGEPPLHDNYFDAYNGGCNSPNGYPMQELPAGGVELCGRGGWYLYGGSAYRDTDWFVVPFDDGGSYEVTLMAETPSSLFELGPQDCENVAVVQQAISQWGQAATLTVTGEPETVVWLWVGSTRFERPDWWPDDEYDYLLTIAGNPVRTEPMSWSRIKALYAE